jgi:two-component system sensor histidine kinase HydH
MLRAPGESSNPAMSPEPSAPSDRDRVQSVLRALEDVARSSSTLAHEIRNPITSVHVALRAVARALDEDEVSVLADLAARLELLEARLRGALDYARPLELVRAPVEPRALLDAACARARPEERERIRVEVDAGCPPIDGDAERLTEALERVVENALEASGETGAVRLRAAPSGDDAVAVTVDDDGAGIPPGLLPTLFRPFATADPGRVGLGLANAKRIVEAHGGAIDAEIDAESSARGTRVRIVLPAVPRGAADVSSG